MFKHELFAHNNLERFSIPEGRMYRLPSGMIVPSVTTVLKNYYSKDGLRKWRKRVGKKAADKISTKARNRGTSLHSLCENYLLNNLETAGVMPLELDDFLRVKGTFDDHINIIYGIEHQLYSDTLGTAGTADLLCEWDGKHAVVDLKTSRRRKKPEWIENYFVQAAVYAAMANELYDTMKFADLVVVMLVEHEQPVLFHKKLDDYMPLVEKIFKNQRKTDEK